MGRVTTAQLAKTLEQITAQMADLARRLEHLEGRTGSTPDLKPAAVPPPVPAPAAVEAVPGGISEEELLAISAAIGAFLGVRAHIRQIRLLSSNAWAQQGRVSIQASHRLQG